MLPPLSSSVVEELQVQILKLLLNNKDKSTVGDHREEGPWRSCGLLTTCVCVCMFQGEASRYIFLNKFRKFLQENASNRGVSHITFT